jgi:hypothetical protein
MALWLLALAGGILTALLQYGWRQPRRLAASPLPAALRALAVTLVLGLLLDAPGWFAARPRPWVALDVSASMARGRDSAAWTLARNAARSAWADSILLVGDSLRAGPIPARPADQATHLGAVVERALASGRPAIVVTDGESPDASTLRELPSGSRIVLVAHRPAPDAALASLDAPRAMIAGDTLEVRITIVAGAGGAGRGTVALALDDRVLAQARLDSLAPWAERDLAVRAKVDAPAGPAVLRAVLSAAGDAEPRNDTLAVGADIARQAGAVFVSTSPDYDARYALAVLRGAVSLPTRGYYRVSPGNWRLDGTLASVSESAVRAAFRDAPIAVLHGDTAIFGAPRKATNAPLALIVPVTGDGSEWYATGAPTSPLSPALAGLPWDSLSPIAVGRDEPKGSWKALDARRGREAFTRTVIAGDDDPRRVVIVAASDLWRWKFRGGASADAYTALWGSIFDFLAAERADARAAVPDARVIRAGEPVRWRRGAATGDSVVHAVLTPRGGGRPDTVALRFAPGNALADSPALPQGTYDVAVPGGRAVLVVNAAGEMVPRPPQVRAGAIGGAAPRGAAPSSRDEWWIYVVLVLALCGEWVSRRRVGMP